MASTYIPPHGYYGPAQIYAAGIQYPVEVGPTPYYQQPPTCFNQQMNPGQQQPVASYQTVAPINCFENHQLTAGGYRPLPGGSTPYSQQPPISLNQQTYTGQQQPVAAYQSVEPPHDSENRQLTAGGYRHLPVGQTPYIHQPPNWYTIPGQQQSFPGGDNRPTRHEISDNSLEMQRFSIVRSFAEALNALVRNSGPGDIFRYVIKIPNRIEMIYEQGQINHHSNSNLGDLETSSQAI